MSNKPELLPCPFCGGTNCRINERKLWTGMRDQTVSAAVQHWCESREGQPQSFMELKGKTVQDAIDAWNQRSEGRR